MKLFLKKPFPDTGGSSIGGEPLPFCDLSKIVRFSPTRLSIPNWRSPSLVVLFLFHVIKVLPIYTFQDET
jgi:hypothetical protein